MWKIFIIQAFLSLDNAIIIYTSPQYTEKISLAIAGPSLLPFTCKCEKEGLARSLLITSQNNIMTSRL